MQHKNTNTVEHGCCDFKGITIKKCTIKPLYIEHHGEWNIVRYTIRYTKITATFSPKLMWRKRYCAIVPKQQFYKTKISPFICACGITAWTSVTVPAVPQRLDRQIAKNLRGRATAWPPRKFTHHHSDRRFCSGTPGISCGATFCDTGNGNHLKLPLS